MEDFSQSRGDDDLFDDEIIPIEPSASKPTPSAAPAQEITEKLQSTSLDSPNAATTDTPIQPSQRGRGKKPLGGRRVVGGPGGPRINRGGGGGLADSKYAPKPALPSQPQSQPQPDSSQDTRSDTAAPATAAETPTQEPSDPSLPPQAPTTKPRAPAVRGDRSQTGGPTRSKLTDSELRAKLDAAKQRSVDLAAAHARAQADKESFDERERVARVRRENEEKRRKELEGEREGNRRRKMEGLARGGGREWDQGKLGQREGSEWEDRARERMRGREENEDVQQYIWQEGERGRGRGRGGRGRGRGMGRGDRGRDRGFANGTNGNERLDVSKEQDFPALPAGLANKVAETPVSASAGNETKPAGLAPKGASWADQVEVEGQDAVK